jgi:ribosome-associated protein
MDVPIRGQTIDLDQLLKFSGQVATGGDAKALIQEGMVTVNGEVETRRRRTLKPGDIVQIQGGEELKIVAPPV